MKLKGSLTNHSKVLLLELSTGFNNGASLMKKGAYGLVILYDLSENQKKGVHLQQLRLLETVCF